MANKRFIGNVAPVADVWTYTVVTVTAMTVHGITCNGKTISITLGSGETTSTAASKLLAAIQATLAGEFQEYVWTVDAAVVTGTAKTAGIPGTFTNASTGGTAGTLSNATPATGPNFINLAANWSGAALPVDGDDWYLDAGSPDMLYGLEYFFDNTIRPAAIYMDDYGGSIGLPAVRGSNAFAIGPSSGVSYPEYRPRYLKLPTGSITIHYGRGRTVPTRGQFHLAGTGTSIYVHGARSPANGEPASVYIQGSTSHPLLSVTQGHVAVAAEFGQTGGFDEVRIGDEGNASEDAKVIFGEGATVPLITNLSGRSEAANTVTSLYMGLNAIEHVQTYGDLTAVVYGGTVIHNSDGTIVFDLDGDRSVLDFSKDPRTRDVGSGCSVLNGARMLDPGNTRGTSEIEFDDTSLPISKLGPSVIVKKA